MSRRLDTSGLVVLLSSLLIACGGETTTDPPANPKVISVVAEAYLNQALNYMQNNSIKRHEINWPLFRRQAIAQAGAARRPADTYDAIRFALRELGDGHSFFRPPGEQSQAGPVPPLASAAGAATLFDDEIGYVSVAAFSGGGDEADALATQYHRLIEGLDTLGVCGWVVDLRGNTGGNMWPMIAGVGPIVGEGVLGFFVDPDSVVNTWTYEHGTSRNDGYINTRVDGPYRLLKEGPPVAVLTDGQTASSGEATAIAFRGRPETKSFGQETWGVSTANRSFVLSDGAMLFLTVSTMADRTGLLYGGKIPPDQIVAGAKTGDPASDAPMAAAVDWLQIQPACEGT